MPETRPAPMRGPQEPLRETPEVRAGFGRLMRGLWASFLVLTFVSFAAQAYLTQTHEAVAQFETDGQMLSGQASDTADAGQKAPRPHNGANCPLCQTIAVAGAYMLPSAAKLPLPANSAVHAELPPLALAATPASPGHIWLGRAPPLA